MEWKIAFLPGEVLDLRYWNELWNNNLCSDVKLKATLIRPTDIPIVRHERLKLDMNPYTDKQYFLTKQERRKAKRRKAYKETVAFKSRLTRMNDLNVKNAWAVWRETFKHGS